MLKRKLNLTFLATFSLAAMVGVVLPTHAASEAECAARADRAARDQAGAGGGAVVGGAGGAVVGAIVGGGRKAVRRGLVAGAVVGGAVGAHKKNEVYKKVYDNCMRGN